MPTRHLGPAFATLSTEDRTLAIADAAVRTGVSTVILEKDFWVTWLLGLLFALPEVAAHLVFKGGTSLSKAYGVIDRFSEDIDLCLVPDFVGANAAAFDALDSRTRRDAAVLEMQQMCGIKTQEVVQPVLETGIRKALGEPQVGNAWLRYEVDAAARSPVIYFRYPTQEHAGFAYIQREVKLELGTLTDQQPTGRYPIRPLVAESFQRSSATGSARSPRSRWSALSGKRRRSCTRSSTVRRTSTCRIVTHATTRTWRVCWSAKMRRATWPMRRCARTWSTGRAACFPAPGLAMTSRGPAAFA